MPRLRATRTGGPGAPTARDHRLDHATILPTADGGGVVERITCG